MFRNGALILDSGERLPVVVTDVSAEGARVEFFTRLQLPDELTLTEPILRLNVRARIVWQQDGVAGLQFIAR